MFNDLIVQFSTLVGVAALIAALVNVAKTIGLVQDGQSAKVSAGLSLAAFVTLVALKIFAPEVDLAGVDEAAADLAVAALYILGFIAQLGLPARFHGFLANSRVPVIGKSDTVQKADSYAKAKSG